MSARKTMERIYEYRRERLREIVDRDYGGKPGRLAAKMKHTQAQQIVAYMVGEKRMGEEFARRVEDETKLPTGILDGYVMLDERTAPDPVRLPIMRILRLVASGAAAIEPTARILSATSDLVQAAVPHGAADDEGDGPA